MGEKYNMKMKEFATKLYGDLYDMEWNENTKRYTPKEGFALLKPSTKFFLTAISIVQIVTKFIDFVYEKNMKSLCQILLSLATIIFLHFKLERLVIKKNDKKEKDITEITKNDKIEFAIALIRESVGMLLFLVSIYMIIFL